MPRSQPERQQILSEQMELLRTEREIQKLLDRIRGELNQLVVEEFQLKSNEISENIAITSGPSNRPSCPRSKIASQMESSKEVSAQLDSTEINQQELNLSTIKTNPYSMEEEEEFFR